MEKFMYIRRWNKNHMKTNASDSVWSSSHDPESDEETFFSVNTKELVDTPSQKAQAKQ